MAVVRGNVHWVAQEHHVVQRKFELPIAESVLGDQIFRQIGLAKAKERLSPLRQSHGGFPLLIGRALISNLVVKIRIMMFLILINRIPNIITTGNLVRLLTGYSRDPGTGEGKGG